MFEGVEERDEHPFDAACQGITIRVHVGSYCHWVSDNSSSCSQFPGYPSSTDVEKLLKRRGGDKARAMQVREGGRRPKGIAPWLITALDSSPLRITRFRAVQ
jgi:hypothetical protein